MNYLAHLFLAHPDPEEQLGSLIADFTRGRLETLANSYSPGIVRGIRIHRKLDQFTDQHAEVLYGKSCFSASRRRYAGIVLDIFYDHLLSRHWSAFCAEEREPFIQQVYQLLLRNRRRLPARLQSQLPFMVEHDWLGSYAEFELLGRVYDRMASRLRRPNGLAGAAEEVAEHYTVLELQFLQFFPDLVSFAGELNRQDDRE